MIFGEPGGFKSVPLRGRIGAGLHPIDWTDLRESEIGSASLQYGPAGCIFVAFDLLYLNGNDLQILPLIGRKAALKNLFRR